MLVTDQTPEAIWKALQCKQRVVWKEWRKGRYVTEGKKQRNDFTSIQTIYFIAISNVSTS